MALAMTDSVVSEKNGQVVPRKCCDMTKKIVASSLKHQKIDKGNESTKYLHF